MAINLDPGMHIPQKLGKVKLGGQQGSGQNGSELGEDLTTLSPNASALQKVSDGDEGRGRGEARDGEGGATGDDLATAFKGMPTSSLSPNELIFFRNYLASMKRIGEKVRTMFDEPKNVKLINAEIDKAIREKKEAIKLILKKITLARHQADRVVQLSKQIAGLLSIINANSDPAAVKRATAALGNLLGQLQQSVKALAGITQEIGDQIKKLPANSREVSQLSRVLGKVKALIQRTDNSCRLLQDRLAQN
jgi:methyl-accepting chemotaxis protein